MMELMIILWRLPSSRTAAPPLGSPPPPVALPWSGSPVQVVATMLVSLTNVNVDVLAGWLNPASIKRANPQLNI